MAMKRREAILVIVFSLLLLLAPCNFLKGGDTLMTPASAIIEVGIDKLLYMGQWGLPEIQDAPNAIEQGGLTALLERLGSKIAESFTARLTPDEEKQYGTQQRFGLASKHLADAVSTQIKKGIFPLGLLQNCNGLVGMLAGLQHAGADQRPLKVGLVWIDSHGDFNTPETTLSGMLGGMPVAISCGLCLERLRKTCGLDPALPTRLVTMVAVRDTDPLEQDLIAQSQIEPISVEDIKTLSPAISKQMERLSGLTDLIYVHVDLDVLEPSDIPGAGLPVAKGPRAKELAAALKIMFGYPKTAAFGIASYPAAKDPEKIGLKSIFMLIEGVIQGIQSRSLEFTKTLKPKKNN
jgi:arginase